MMAEGTPPAATPTLADQVSKLYELVAGYHATNLLEIARELDALCRDAGLQVIEETGFSRFHILVAAKE